MMTFPTHKARTLEFRIHAVSKTNAKRTFISGFGGAIPTPLKSGTPTFAALLLCNLEPGFQHS